MEIIPPKHVDGEKVYPITTLGMAVEEIDVIGGATQRIQDPGYAFWRDDAQQNIGQHVDIIL